MSLAVLWPMAGLSVIILQIGIYTLFLPVMDSIKQRQVASLIHKSLGEVFTREGSNYYGRAFVTISGVKLTPDLQLARIFISIYNVSDKASVLKMINQQMHWIKKSLYQQIRHQMRVMPELEFHLDDTLDEVQKMEELFKKINPEEESSGKSNTDPS